MIISVARISIFELYYKNILTFIDNDDKNSWI